MSKITPHHFNARGYILTIIFFVGGFIILKSISSHSPHNTARGLRPQSPDAVSSVEVLDLGDYGRIARPRDDFAYVDHTAYIPEYPSTPPRTFSLTSRASLSTSPPSLVSGHSSTSHSQPARLYTPPPSQRPFSLPAPRISSPSPPSNSGRSPNYPWLADPQAISTNREVDVSNFPEWSRNWYEADNVPKASLDLHSPIPTFDPALVSSSYEYSDTHGLARPYTSTNESHRDLLPWSLGDDSMNRRITPEMKEERIRMLEREFGRNGAKESSWHPGTKDIGSVDAKGNIITPGPRKRFLVRFMQGLFALGAALASLYSALVSHAFETTRKMC